MSALTIDVFSDVVCPWCLIGSARLDRVLASMEPPLDVKVTYRPFLLHPEATAEGINVHEMLRERYGTDPKAIFERVESEAKASGVPLDLSKQPFSYSTLGAHTLIRHAAPGPVQRALVRALFHAHFLDAKKISDPEVLVALATAHGGFTAEEARRLIGDEAEQARTRDEALAASRQGIRGVPFFVFNEEFGLSGAQSEDVLRKAIEKALA